MKVMMLAPSLAPLTEWSEAPGTLDAEGRGYQNLILAQAATMLEANGHAVRWHTWNDTDVGCAEARALSADMHPELVVILATTPTIESAWHMVDDIKRAARGHWRCKVALVGSHVSALPDESIRNSQADYVIGGGDFDFLLTGLCARLHSGSWHSSVRLEPGIWRRVRGKSETTGKWRPDHNLSLSPSLDREMVGLWPGRRQDDQHAWERHAAIYTARDCWWARCTHCSRKVMSPPGSYRLRSPEKVLNEVGLLIAKYSVNRITDLSGSLPTGLWLRRFCQGMIERGYYRKVRLTCSLKPGSIGRSEAALMAKAGFDTVGVRLHSANQHSLERLGSNMTASDIEESLRLWRATGLRLTAAAEIGWPWESSGDAANTRLWTERLTKEGTLTGCRLMPALPFPGTSLYEECLRREWLQVEAWSDYDGSKTAMKSSVTDDELSSLRTINLPGRVKGFANVRQLNGFSIRIRQWLWRMKKRRLARTRAGAPDAGGSEVGLLRTPESNEAENSN